MAQVRWSHVCIPIANLEITKYLESQIEKILWHILFDIVKIVETLQTMNRNCKRNS